MPTISRRHFSAALLALTARPRTVWGATSGNIKDTLHSSLDQHKVPTCVAMAATANKITYTGAFGKRDSASGIDVTPEEVEAAYFGLRAAPAAQGSEEP